MSHPDDPLVAVESEIREALSGQPDHPGLLAALGGVRLQAGDADQAVLFLERAARLAPDNENVQSDYGAALIAAERFKDAEATLRMALAIHPASDNLRFNLARCLQLQRRHGEALTELEKVRQSGADLFKLRGDLQKEAGDWRSAAQSYLLALQLSPENAAYLNDLGVLLEMNGNPGEYRRLWEELAMTPMAGGVVHFFLGNALRAEGEYAKARAAYERALEFEPEMSEALNNLALVLGKLERHDEAVAVLRRATELNPALVAPQTNLGALMSRSTTVDEAEALLARAVALDPTCVDARVNYGAVLMRQRRFTEAEQLFRQVLSELPGHASSELNMGLLLLTEGRFAEGWPYYESRWKMPQLAEKRPHLSAPAWTGEPLDGKTLFVYSEQGFGDNIQFFRYLNELKARFPSVRLVYYSMHALTDLCRGSLADADIRVLPWGEPIPPHDFQIPLLSLPWRCGTVVHSIPAAIPYLRAETALVAEWREKLPTTGLPRIGLVWATSETFIYRSAKTIKLALLQPLIDQPGVTWVNLQFGKEAAEIAQNGWDGRFVNPMAEVRNFSDTAALIENLDLVISVDTAVAHLAGAMGRRVWMLDRFDTDWRWLPPREDSPWYPGMRIFRQDKLGCWAGVIERVRTELQAFLQPWPNN